MALLPIERLKLLAEVKRVATSERAALQQKIAHLKAFSIPADEPQLRTQLDTLFAPTLTELTATVTRINTAINNVNIVAADRAAYGLAAETAAKSVPD
jgi:hypothetical protein